MDANRNPENAMEFGLDSLEATKHFGQAIADALTEPNPAGATIITLSGNLGAGKTTLVQCIGKALGVREVINSPTFTMMNEYHSGSIPLYHFDFYRIMDMAGRAEEELSLDLVASEFDEISQSKSLILIEWPEYFIVEGKNYLESLERLSLELSHGENEDTRQVQLIPSGVYSEALMQRIFR